MLQYNQALAVFVHFRLPGNCFPFQLMTLWDASELKERTVNAALIQITGLPMITGECLFDLAWHFLLWTLQASAAQHRGVVHWISLIRRSLSIGFVLT